MRVLLSVSLFLVLAATLPTSAAPPPDLLKMKFGEVREIAPGVFFRYSRISPTDESAFDGSNNLWVVFRDFVVVIDANFPRQAADVIAAVRKTTKKPIRYVFDTHHHGDHAWGNGVFVELGASVIAHTNCGRLMRETGPKDFADARKSPVMKKHMADGKFAAPTVLFDDKLVLDDGTQRIEFRHFGHSHTAGDAVAWLPKHGILCTGDACVNGPYNFMGHSDSASWVRCLEKMQQLPVKMIVPGHGYVTTPELLATQRRYFVELRQAVRAGIDAGKDDGEIAKGFQPAWYKEWTKVVPSSANVEHVFKEMTGRVTPGEFSADDLDIYAGPSVTKESPGWTRPRRIVLPSGWMPARIQELKRLAPEVEFVPVKNAREAATAVDGADALLGFARPEVLAAGKKLRWVQVEGDEAVEGRFTLTSTRRAAGPDVADQAFALLLSLTRGVGPTPRNYRTELRGKTMLVVGLGGSGRQVARRAAAFDMKVLALDDATKERPSFVFSLEGLAKLADRLPEADVVVLAVPLSAKTRGLIGEKQLRMMKKSAFLVDSAHEGLVDVKRAGVAVKEGRLAGLGLELAGGKPADHPLAGVPGVVLTAPAEAPSPEARERQWRLVRENVRRFVAGEPLLGVVR